MERRFLRAIVRWYIPLHRDSLSLHGTKTHNPFVRDAVVAFDRAEVGEFAREEPVGHFIVQFALFGSYV
eukprot:15338323-Ditylum_brightwellii.AAC.1